MLSSTIAADAQTRLDNELAFQAARDAAVSRNTRAIVMLRPGAALPAEFAPYATRRLRIIDGYVVSVPNDVLARLAGNSAVTAIHTDRPATNNDYRTSLTVGSLAVNQSIGLTGSGIGIAVIDSGVAPWHDDLTNRAGTQYFRTGISVLPRLSTSSAAPRSPTTITATARTSPASSPETGTTRTGRKPASLLMRISFR